MISAFAALFRWSLFIAVIAVGAHAAALFYLPGVLMARAMDRAQAGAGLNAMAFPPRSDATSRFMARPDPGVLLSTCVFNLSQSQLKIHVPVPSEGDWSLTIYGDDARPFYYINNQTAGGTTLDAVLVEPGGMARTDGLAKIKAPSFDGLVLVRSRIADEASLAESDRVRHLASCQPIPR